MLSAFLLLSMTTFSQKAELKAAEKAFKKKDYSTTISTLEQAESLIMSSEAEYKAKYYYLMGMSLYADGTKPANIDAVVEALNTLISIEKESGDNTYSNKSADVLNKLIQDAVSEAQASFETARGTNSGDDYAKAAQAYERVYLLSPTDTSFLYNAALIYSVGGDFEASNERYIKLLDLGYTGIATTYKATSSIDGTDMYFNSKKDMDLQVKLGVASNPVVEVADSKTLEMVKAVALNYGKLENNEKALEFISRAREENPDDYDLIIEEANVYYRMGDNAKFKEKLEEAIAINPENPNLHFNVGVMNMDLGDNEAATASFKKAIELKPDFADAHNNLGAIELDKAKPVQEEMNANASNFAKYDKIKEEKLLPIYRAALVHYENAYKYSPDDESLRNLLNSLYENLGMDKSID